MSSQSEQHDVAVVGGGVIGLAVAWRAAQRGLRTLVLDAGEDGAWRYAAGMLAPVTEAEFGERRAARPRAARARRLPRLLRRARRRRAATRAAPHRHARRRPRPRRGRGARAAARVPARARPRGRAPAPEPGPPRRARARADGPARARRARRRRRRPAPPRRRARRRGGGAPAARSAARARSTRPRATLLRAAQRRRRRRRLERQARRRCPSARSRARSCACATRAARTSSTRTIRTREGYLVPRGEGRYVLGATVEERGWDTAPTAGATHELIRDLAEVVPGVLELEIEELGAGLRPGTPDNLPSSARHGGARVGDRPLPQRDPARRRHRRGRGRRCSPATALPEWAAACDPARFAEVRRMNGASSTASRPSSPTGATVEAVLAALDAAATAASRSRSTPRSSRAASGRRTS